MRVPNATESATAVPGCDSGGISSWVCFMARMQPAKASFPIAIASGIELPSVMQLGMSGISTVNDHNAQLRHTNYCGLFWEAVFALAPCFL